MYIILNHLDQIKSIFKVMQLYRNTLIKHTPVEHTSLYTHCLPNHLDTTVHGKILTGGNLANLMNCELFTKFSSPFTDAPKMYLAYALT